jgi:hypothetical protein
MLYSSKAIRLGRLGWDSIAWRTLQLENNYRFPGIGELNIRASELSRDDDEDHHCYLSELSHAPR